MVKELYDSMAKEYGFTVVDATKQIPLQQETVRRIVAEKLDLAKFKERVKT